MHLLVLSCNSNVFKRANSQLISPLFLQPSILKSRNYTKALPLGEKKSLCEAIFRAVSPQQSESLVEIPSVEI